MMSYSTSHEPKLVYDPRAKTSKLPIRKACAICIHNAKSNILIVRRNQLVDEYKGVWSFPSVFIDEDNEDLEATIRMRLKQWLSLDVGEMKLVGKRMGLRPRWRLLMYLFIAKQAGDPAIQTKKYDDLKWVDGRRYFSRYTYDELGDCAKAYIDYTNDMAKLISD